MFHLSTVHVKSMQSVHTQINPSGNLAVCEWITTARFTCLCMHSSTCTPTYVFYVLNNATLRVPLITFHIPPAAKYKAR